MDLSAVGDLTFGPPCTILRHVTAFEAMEAQPLCCQALNAFLDGGIDEDIADLCRMHPPADPKDVVNLLLRRRRN